MHAQRSNNAVTLLIAIGVLACTVIAAIGTTPATA